MHSPLPAMALLTAGARAVQEVKIKAPKKVLSRQEKKKRDKVRLATPSAHAHTSWSARCTAECCLAAASSACC